MSRQVFSARSRSPVRSRQIQTMVYFAFMMRPASGLRLMYSSRWARHSFHIGLPRSDAVRQISYLSHEASSGSEILSARMSAAE